MDGMLFFTITVYSVQVESLNTMVSCEDVCIPQIPETLKIYTLL